MYIWNSSKNKSFDPTRYKIKILIPSSAKINAFICCEFNIFTLVISVRKRERCDVHLPGN